jgi:transcriptional regulator with XRE-family HTH domain
MDTVGERIKSLRIRFALSQDQFCKKIGIKTSSLSRIENGNTDPSMSTIIALMQCFKVSADWLLTGEGDSIREANNKGELGINQSSDDLDEQMPVIRDRKLQKCIQFLINLWTEGNANKKGWIIVQLERAFPEFEEWPKKPLEKKAENEETEQ